MFNVIVKAIVLPLCLFCCRKMVAFLLIVTILTFLFFILFLLLGSPFNLEKQPHYRFCTICRKLSRADKRNRKNKMAGRYKENRHRIDPIGTGQNFLKETYVIQWTLDKEEEDAVPSSVSVVSI